MSGSQHVDPRAGEADHTLSLTWSRFQVSDPDLERAGHGVAAIGSQRPAAASASRLPSAASAVAPFCRGRKVELRSMPAESELDLAWRLLGRACLGGVDAAAACHASATPALSRWLGSRFCCSENGACRHHTRVRPCACNVLHVSGATDHLLYTAAACAIHSNAAMRTGVVMVFQYLDWLAFIHNWCCSRPHVRG